MQWPSSASFSAYSLLPLVSMLASYTVLRLLLSPQAPLRFLDHPNERSLHRDPVPRTGGIAIVLGLLAGTVWIAGFGLALACALTLAGISLLDDWRGVPQAIRLASHVVVATAFVALSVPSINPLMLGLLVVAIGWMTNLYNFMDGSDGLAGGMAVIGFGAFFAAAWFNGSDQLAAAALSVCVAALGFLLFNFPPARIFMGDVGSICLGFLASAFGIIGWTQHTWPLWFPVVVFAPFVMDASVTLARRAFRGERVWQAHKEHYYQRLIQMGWSHRRTALVEYALMILCASIALVMQAASEKQQALALAALAVLAAILMTQVDRSWRRFKHA